ncbi:MAG: Fe(III) dicitrate transporter FecA, partial [Pseudomonas sp.]|nr:Fe(III) dicitrate transporter FecA [Pseudomonas sp.]
MSARPALPSSLAPLVRALRHALLGASLSLAGLSMAHAAEATPRVYHIAPSELETALTQFGRESGVLISYGSQITNGLKSRGLEGQYAIEQGLNALLEGTGLQARADGNNGFTLQQASAAVSGPIELGASNVVGDWLG